MSYIDYIEEERMRSQLQNIKIHDMLWVTNSLSCFYCGFTDIEKLILHHISYGKQSIIYNQFENTLEGRIEYYSSLLNEVMSHPTNFIILCFKCHAFRHNKIYSRGDKS